MGACPAQPNPRAHLDSLFVLPLGEVILGRLLQVKDEEPEDEHQERQSAAVSVAGRVSKGFLVEFRMIGSARGSLLTGGSCRFLVSVCGGEAGERIYAQGISPAHVVCLEALSLRDPGGAREVSDEAPRHHGRDELADGPPSGEEGQRPLQRHAAKVRNAGPTPGGKGTHLVRLRDVLEEEGT